MPIRYKAGDTGFSNNVYHWSTGKAGIRQCSDSIPFLTKNTGLIDLLHVLIAPSAVAYCRGFNSPTISTDLLCMIRWGGIDEIAGQTLEDLLASDGTLGRLVDGIWRRSASVKGSQWHSTAVVCCRW